MQTDFANPVDFEPPLPRGQQCSLFIDDESPSPFRLLIEAKQVLDTLSIICLIYVNFDSTVHLTTVNSGVFRLYPYLLSCILINMSFFSWKSMPFILS